MEDIENQSNDEKELLFTQQDFDSYKSELEAKFQEKEKEMKEQLEKDAKKNSMTELERIRLELDEMKEKYQEKENECQIAKEKEETFFLLEDANLGKELLDVVFTPLNMEATEVKIEILKNYFEKIQKEINETGCDVVLPRTSNQALYDPFIDGFESNTL